MTTATFKNSCPTFYQAGKWLRQRHWPRWVATTLLAATLVAILWISGVTSLVILSIFWPSPPGSMKLDLFDELRLMKQVLEWVVPLGGASLVAYGLQQAIVGTLKADVILSLLVGWLGAVACAISIWQGMDWIHGGDIHLWQNIWWAGGK